MYLNIFPAYGRTYASAEEIIAAWENGIDFNSHLGYLSCRDIKRIKLEGFEGISIYGCIPVKLDF